MYTRKVKVMVLAIAILMLSLMPYVSAEEKEGNISSDIIPFMIKVINKDTGRGIPCVELRTINDAVFYTDSAGIVAFNEPGMMNEDIYFYVTSDGYLFPEDKNGNRGTMISIKPGGSVVLEMEQTNLAERLYRITGESIYGHSYMLGLPTPINKPLLNGRVTGSDSIHTTVYNNRLHWFWGDTGGPFHVLGNFRVTSATSLLPEDGGLDPSVGVNLEYFTDPSSGFVKKMVPPLPDGNGVVWLCVLKAKEGEPLISGYATLGNARGLLKYNDETQEFELLKEMTRDFKDGDWQIPYGGKSTRYEENGTEYWLFSRPWPNVRVKADIDAVQDPEQYEAFTPLKPGTKYDKANTQLERDENGNLVWGWKRNTDPIDQLKEEELLKLGVLSESDDLYYQFKDVDTNERVQLHACSIKWNEYRKRYVLTGLQMGGSSFLGEIWYAESENPQGPWEYAKKIISHKAYSFYNPLQHEYFFEDNGRIIYFEGTYTASYTNELQTPHYNYNQMMYRLDVDDLDLPLKYIPPEETPGSTDEDPVTSGDETDTEPTETIASPNDNDDDNDKNDDGNEIPGTGDNHIRYFLFFMSAAVLLLASYIFFRKRTADRQTGN